MSSVLCAALTVAALSGAPEQKTQVLPYANPTVMSPIPEYAKVMTDDMFVKWARAQNQMSHLKARQAADEWEVRNPALDIYTQNNNYTSSSSLSQSERASARGASLDAYSTTQYDGDSIQRTYRRDRWAGGPVTIINPFCRKGVNE